MEVENKKLCRRSRMQMREAGVTRVLFHRELDSESLQKKRSIQVVAHQTG